MTDKSINIEKMIALFNHIAMREGYNMIVNEIDPLKFFSSKEKFYNMIDKMIEYYIESEEYEKCAILLQIKKQNGWKEPKVITN
tara:strand:+ start:1571 stop:1822 length:252 start_codon:yes stop_codon:yes gene_type:complete